MELKQVTYVMTQHIIFKMEIIISALPLSGAIVKIRRENSCKRVSAIQKQGVAIVYNIEALEKFLCIVPGCIARNWDLILI